MRFEAVCCVCLLFSTGDPRAGLGDFLCLVFAAYSNIFGFPRSSPVCKPWLRRSMLLTDVASLPRGSQPEVSLLLAAAWRHAHLALPQMPRSSTHRIRRGGVLFRGIAW